LFVLPLSEWEQPFLWKSLIIKAHEKDINHLAFNADDTYIVSASKDGTVKVWDSYTGDCIDRAYNTIEGRAQLARIYPDFSEIGSLRRNAMGWWVDHNDKMLCLYRPNGTQAGMFHGDATITVCAISPHGFIAVGDETGRVMFLHYTGL